MTFYAKRPGVLAAAAQPGTFCPCKACEDSYITCYILYETELRSAVQGIVNTMT